MDATSREYDPTADEDEGTVIPLWFDLDERDKGAGKEV
jgi:hypothetical protein